jgi:hypothetical protein
MNTALAIVQPAIALAAPPETEEVGEPLEASDARLRHIATAAYFKAEARGFQPGRELQDWLEAEAEYDGWRQ